MIHQLSLFFFTLAFFFCFLARFPSSFPVVYWSFHALFFFFKSFSLYILFKFFTIIPSFFASLSYTTFFFHLFYTGFHNRLHNHNNLVLRGIANRPALPEVGGAPNSPPSG